MRFLCGSQLKRRLDLDVDCIAVLFNPVLIRIQIGSPVLRKLLAVSKTVAILDKLFGDFLQILDTPLPTMHHKPHGYLARCPSATFEVREPFGNCTQP